MEFSRSELEKCDKVAEEMQDSKKKLKKSKRSFVNLETLDDDDQSEMTQNTEDDQTTNASGGLTQRHLHASFILENAFRQVKAIGSSTAMIGIQNKGKMSICNLGDSGFQLYRQTSNQIYLA